MIDQTDSTIRAIGFTRDIPVIAQTDALVIGGGPAGIGAAVGAARAGAATVLVERYGFLGGMSTAGLVGPFMTSFSGDGKTQLIGGVFEELVRRMEVLGGAIHPAQVRAGSAESGFRIYGHDHVTPFDPEAVKIVAAEMMIEYGVNLFLHTSFTEPLLEENRVRGAVIHNKSGLQAILAEVVVDCSADADVAYRAGVPTTKGRIQDGLMQPMTMFFRVGNVDDEAVEAYIAAHPEQHEKPFAPIVEAAREQGDFPIPRDRVGIYRTPQRGVWRVNTTRLHRLDGTDVKDLTKAEIEGRKQVMALMAFFREYLPGFQDVILLDTAAQIGVRETRRIVGDYVLTVEDLVSGRHFEDVIALASYPIDIHSPTDSGGGVAVSLEDPSIRAAPIYEIPYRTLLPKAVEQLLVAGRCLSATHEAAGAVRVMPPCFAMGQAAGAAAAIAAAEEEPPRRIRVDRLQQILLDQGAILFWQPQPLTQQPRRRS